MKFKMWLKTQWKSVTLFFKNNWKTILTVGINKLYAYIISLLK